MAVFGRALEKLRRSHRRRGALPIAGEVVREELRLIEERDGRLAVLRALENSITQGSEVTDEELDAAISEKSADLRAPDTALEARDVRPHDIEGHSAWDHLPSE